MLQKYTEQHTHTHKLFESYKDYFILQNPETNMATMQTGAQYDS